MDWRKVYENENWFSSHSSIDSSQWRHGHGDDFRAVGLSQTGPFLIFKTETERKQTETQTIPITDASMQMGFPEQNDRNSYGSSS
ncbi:hypothetical protein DLM76_10670 [Leptospira yasudae]|nr:hypothetical protein DLM76_10670 [Leptospira yasudae]